jgi:hypothetical protein
MHAAGVPTVWLNLLQHVSKHKLKLRYVKRVCIAGSAPPRSMIEALERWVERTAGFTVGFSQPIRQVLHLQ